MDEKEVFSEDSPIEETTDIAVSETDISEENQDVVTDRDSVPDENLTDKETEPEQLPKKKQISIQIRSIFERLGIPDMALLRIISAFFIVSGINLDKIRESKVNDVAVNPISAWKDFVGEVNVSFTILMMAAVFLMLTAAHYFMPKKYRVTDQLTAVVSIFYFDALLLWRSGNLYLSFAVMIVSVVLIYYAMNKLKSQKIFNKIPWWIWGVFVLVAAAAVTAFVAITTCATHKSYGTACHDFGLFVQMYYNLAENGTALTTCERDYPISHFKIHASYIFYALVPVFKLFPKAETLLVAQAVLAMGGVVPLFLIAKRRNFKGFALLFMGLAYTFCIGIVGPCYYEFHENAFLPTILMWLLWAVDRRNYVMFYIMSVLTCIVKEDAPLYVICIGMYLFFDEKKSIHRMHGVIMSLFAGAYMLFITNWLSNHGDGQMMMDTRFGLLMVDHNGGLAEVVKNALLNPAYLFSLLIQEQTITFFLQVMLPFLFIPFFTRKIRRYLLMVPFIVMNLIIGAGYGYAANVGFQYLFGPVCLLFYMVVINVDDMGQKQRQNIPVVLGAAAMILTFSNNSPKWSSYVVYNAQKEYFDVLDEMVKSIPSDASVGTDTFMVPHAALRDEVHVFDGNDWSEDGTINNKEDFDFLVISVRSDIYEKQRDVIVNNGYKLWAEIEGKYQVYVSSAYVPE